MTGTPPSVGGGAGWLAALTAPVERTAYRLQHRSLAVSTGIAYRLWSRLLRPGAAPLDAGTIRCLVRRFESLLERDLANADAGVYPRALLRQFPIVEYAMTLPEALLEAPRVLWRRYRNRTNDLPAGTDRESYPAYYLRNFHWQSDGWLSERSARLYDPSVEFLFGGVADVMRRMAIPPVVEAVAGAERPRVLDVGCGTGRFLLQLSRAVPRARLYGLDLSPYYVRHARKVLAECDVTLASEPAETMPWADSAFDAVTSIFMFHELPAPVRRRIAGEMCRVTKPGGRVVICDSAQLADSPEIKDALLAFPEAYHEPFYRGYLGDDLAGVLADAGLEVESVEAHLVSKVVVARRPVRVNGDAAAA
jgi:ubiquinone/menaquinone biosynthesis C-methylase UbiE